MRRAGLTLVSVIAIVLAGFPAVAGGDPLPPERLVQKVTRNVNQVLADARRQLANLAQLPSVHAQDAGACSAEMAARAGSPRYTALGATDRAGDLYCLSTAIASPINVADRPYFLHAIGTRGFGVGDFQFGRQTGIGSLGLGFAVVAGDRVTGIVLSPLALAWLERRLDRRFGSRAFDVLIVDGHGTVLARVGKVKTNTGVNLGRKSLVKAMLTENEGEGSFRVGGQQVESAFDTVPLSDGGVHVAVSVRR